MLLQVHPSVSRLCAPIEGTDEARIADCLGLDPSKFRHRTQANAPGDILATPSGFMDDEERYKVGTAPSFQDWLQNCLCPS